MQQNYQYFASHCIRSVGHVPLFWLLRFILDRYVFQAVASVAVSAPNQNIVNKATSQPVQELQLTKFTESLWKAGVYICLHATTWRVLWSKPWLWDTDAYWRLDNSSSTGQLQYEDVEKLYDLQIGFYLTSIVMLAFWETRRKDFPVMMTHHFVTLGLLLGSLATGYTRVGTVILLLHDFSDIFLELAKLFNYAGKESWSTLCFVVMAVSWAMLRLYIFPVHVVYSCMFGAQHVIGRPVDQWYPFNAMLCTLVLMHVYWFVLILKVAVTVLGGQAKDVREEQ